MWFINYTDLYGENNYINNIFQRKIDAFAFIRSNNELQNSECYISNINTSFVKDSITEENLVYIREDKELCFYGKIVSISQYLVCVEKPNQDIVELTKARLNKEIINKTAIIK